MPNYLDTHVLTVDANVIHKIDTANPANIYSMWTGEFRNTPRATLQPTDRINTVFSRCAESVEQGRRLENLSWRLWQKEQLVENKNVAAALTCTAQTATTPPQTIPSQSSFNDLPQLSGSVESLADADETIEFTSVSTPLEIARPRIRRQDSSASSRSKRERSHTSSDDFEKMIVSIVHDKAPLSAPTHTALPMAPRKQIQVPPPHPALSRSGSTTTESQSPDKNSDAHSDDSHTSPNMQPRTTVVRGFSPSQVAVSRSAQPTIKFSTDSALPEPHAAPAPKTVMSKKPVAFALGGSYSSSEAGQSFESRKGAPAFLAKKATFRLGGSSEEEGSLKSALSPRGGPRLAQKKQASFSSRITAHTIEPDSAIESDSDYIDESAIDDEDDSSDWEDSNEDSGNLSVDDKWLKFKRVDSNANLTSRRSLITLMLAQNDDRARRLGNQASQSTSALPQARNNRKALSPDGSPNDSDEAPLMMRGARQSNLMPIIREVPRTAAQPIATTSHCHAQAALSPRTTRRNMLATELTESLRRHLLWERSQKSSTANAVLKRRHTSQDVANLKQYPEQPCMKKSEDANSGSWNQYFQKETHEGYHSKGW